MPPKSSSRTPSDSWSGSCSGSSSKLRFQLQAAVPAPSCGSSSKLRFQLQAAVPAPSCGSSSKLRC
eukprot:scaffold2538_cov235-Pinguiococcus_pyrenoidosus.AAC.8